MQVNKAISIPNGANRNKCHFIVNTNNGQNVTINNDPSKGDKGTVTASNTGDTLLQFLVIEVDPEVGSL